MSSMVSEPVLRAAPRLGFAGLGWIGRTRMRELAESGAAHIVAVSDISVERVADCRSEFAGAVACSSIDELVEQDVEGIVIATPSALHAEQACAALRRGKAVFCQKPLARTAVETEQVIRVARAADRLLGVDLSYRHTAAMCAIHDIVQAGGIGAVFAVDLTFHNAYAPDRGWARDPRLAGGGCVIDLGIHLIDLAWWILGPAPLRTVSAQLYARGRRLAADPDVCEDFALATLERADDIAVRLACSWESSIGRDAVIDVVFHGSEGAAALRNVNGSFHDFTAERHRSSGTEVLVTPPDGWGGRALIEWSRRLARDPAYDPSIESLVDVAAALDAVLGR